MGLFDAISNIGKSVVSGVQSIGKSVASGVTNIGKGALGVARIASGALDSAIGTVKTVAGEAAKIPVAGELLKSLLDSPIGRQVQSAFQSVEEVNEALKEAVSIGNRIEKFADEVSNVGVEGLKNPSNRQRLSTEIININRDIQNSKVGQKVSSIPAFQRQVKKFNDASNKVQSKLGKETVERIKRDVRQRIAVQPPPLPTF